jgi:DNA polymerase-3 subunit gamma/tau
VSYLALARKYRPRRFAEVMGQPAVVKALSHALDADKLHPVILLTGTRGVGKTTLARIIAKGLNCDTGVSSEPCGVCSACQSIDQGRFVDLLEIDAASHTGVDNVRELIENAQYAPSRGRYKVYLIDEVHMLSKNAFNALLKTLEEPPPQVKFILATTDPQKVLITVLSRCLQFNLKRLGISVIRDNLHKVLAAEGLSADTAALTELAQAADGSMRDGMSLLDQALVFCGQDLSLDNVSQMLGTDSRRFLFALLEALANRDHAALAGVFQQLEQNSPDFMALISDLAALLQRLALLQQLPDLQSDDDSPPLLALLPRFKAADLQIAYQAAVFGRRDLQWAPDPRLGFEMAVLRMFAFRIEDGAAPASGGNTGSNTENSPRRFTPTKAAAPVTVAPVAPVAAVAPPAVQQVREDLPWFERIDTLGLDGFTKQLARNCAWLERSQVQGQQVVRLGLDGKQSRLFQEDRRRQIETALAQQLGDLRLQIEVQHDKAAASPILPPRPAVLPTMPAATTMITAAEGPLTAADEQKRRQQLKQREALESFQNDPTVQHLQQHLGASIRPDSVLPWE